MHAAPATFLVTGGAGFIGTNFIRHTLTLRPQWHLICLDALTYAGNPANLDDLPERYGERYRFIHGSILDEKVLSNLFREENIAGVIHFAAESHVDRSIHKPQTFIETNVNGTCRLLTICQEMWEKTGKPAYFRFLHVSTDEVYGSLDDVGYFTEASPYAPNSPYSASKAASDHFVRAWHHTFGLPAIVTNCSNNYGPYQFPEKLIPLMILNILEERELPVYGDGANVRDWLYVIDHCEALLSVLEKGLPGETYLIGGGAEKRNIEIVELLCERLDQILDRRGRKRSHHLIRFVTDRPGHDYRYAIDASKIAAQLGWRARFQFEDAIEATIHWYLAHRDWVAAIRSGAYRQWLETNYDNR
ncbi:MAG: dTDP-glucose 4,6-dehydratase [Desulfobacterales bacterium]|nr:dTDP-glucose 4,6-dehydratase [Desulfobacterales bacterium]